MADLVSLQDASALIATGQPMLYRLADPVANLAEFFGEEFDARKVKPAFSCNCILNFLYAELEGKRTGNATGPITFGEIAYMQLNQTLVYVTFDRKE